jgi:hypothetical protein
MRLRLWFGVLAVAIALLVFGAVARACDLVSGTISPDSARAGDPITFSISGLLKDATYSVKIGGQTKASGVSEGTSVYGSVPMPDYGSQPRTVSVEVLAQHEEDGFDKTVASKGVQYLPPPSVPVTSPTEAAASSNPVPAHHRARKSKEPQPSVVTDHAQSEKHHSTGTGTGARSAPADSVGSEPNASSPSSGSGEAKASDEESSAVPNRVLHALGSTTKVGPAGVPTIGLLAMALIFIGGTALAAFVIYLSQTGPDPKAAIKSPAPLGPDPMEVELQEMIADEMARQLLSDLNLSDPSVSSR